MMLGWLGFCYAVFAAAIYSLLTLYALIVLLQASDSNYVGLIALLGLVFFGSDLFMNYGMIYTYLKDKKPAEVMYILIKV